MSQLFTERIAFKPFEYPDYYNEGWLKQMQAFWLHTEIPMQMDVKDWNENLSESEKHLVGKAKYESFDVTSFSQSKHLLGRS